PIVAGEWIEKTYGAELVDAMKMIKQTVDPHNLLNPGKMFAAPPMDTHLRFGESYQVKAWPATLKFDHEGGLAGAIEQCNGQGVCRKRTGVMCPSFQATRDEAFSTRGRANLLRALISSPMVDGFRSRNGMEWKRSKFLKAVYASLDLCLACKGCSAECPSGVDMPRLKYEFLNEYYKHHARPLRDYFFGYFHIVSRWIQPIAPLINVLTGVSWIRKSLARLLGLSPERPFPKFSHTTAKVPGMKKGAKTVLLLVDVFSRYIDAEVEQAALDILHWSGHEVRVLPVIGAGASLLSRGFIEGARSHANQILAAIETLGGGAEFDIVGCEPPEVYCLKHEYLSLLPDRSRDIERFRHRVWLLDEFLLRSEAFGRFLSKIESSNGRIVQDRIPITFHPHCHQRAEGLAEDDFPLGVSASVTLLRRFGFEVAVMDAGCCGMAGTFGYEAEHHQLSMQVGELGVLPAARMADRLVSTGSVCRMQIRHGAGKDVSHPLVLVRDRVRDFMDPARSRVD
ncbi:MAG: hypothetical protein FJZ87_08075, partial [Chloroflexi bacterium]|nr:hypothetical protein [Chloroflexota bacterium]